MATLGSGGGGGGGGGGSSNSALSKNATFGDTRASSASVDLLRASVAASIIFDT